MATDLIPLDELRAAAREASSEIIDPVDPRLRRSACLPVICDAMTIRAFSTANGRSAAEQLIVRIGMVPVKVSVADRLLFLLAGA